MSKILSFLPLFIFYFAGSGQTVDQLLKQADSLCLDKKFKEAILVYEKAWIRDSSNYQLYLGRGSAYHELEDLEKAFLDYTKAAQLRPDSSEPYHRRAILLYSMRYPDESITDNTRALDLATNDTMRMVSFLNRANAKIQKRDFQGAYEDLTRASFFNPDDLGLLNNLATVLDELGRVDEAISYLERVIKLDSTFIGPYVNLGFQHTKLKKYKKAVEYFNKALLLDKNDPLALNNRGLALYHLNDLKGALADINKSISLYPGNAYAYKNRALVYLAQKKSTLACADLAKANEYGFTEMYGDEVNDLLRSNCK